MSVVKIVILNWNGAAHLRRFLPSVVRTAPPGVEIVVADNGSTDGSAALVEREFPSVTLLRLPETTVSPEVTTARWSGWGAITGCCSTPTSNLRRGGWSR